MNPLSTMRFDLAPPKEPVPQPKQVGDIPKKAAPAAQNSCEAHGGKCLNLSPTNCPNGSWADMTTHSCGTSDGLGCCMPKGGEAKAAPTTKPAAGDTAKADPTAAVPASASAPPAATTTAPSAAPTASVAPADTRDTTGFSAAPEAGADEKFSGSTLLVEAYAAIWLVMMAWLLLIWTKSQSLTARLNGLEAAIDRAEKRADANKPPSKERPKEKKEPASEEAS